MLPTKEPRCNLKDTKPSYLYFLPLLHPPLFRPFRRFASSIIALLTALQLCLSTLYVSFANEPARLRTNDTSMQHPASVSIILTLKLSSLDTLWPFTCSSTYITWEYVNSHNPAKNNPIARIFSMTRLFILLHAIIYRPYRPENAVMEYWIIEWRIRHFPSYHIQHLLILLGCGLNCNRRASLARLPSRRSSV